MSQESAELSANKAISELIVDSCLRIREGDMVHISSWEHTTELASDLAIQCFKAGAVPLITLMTDDLFEKALEEGSPKGISTVPRHELAIASSIDAYIHISGPADPSIMERVPPDRLQSFSQAGAETACSLMNRKVRQANIHLGKLTRKRARSYRLKYPIWRNAVHSALLVNYEEMKARGEKLASRLMRVQTIRLLTDQGTDLRFGVDRKAIHVDDGVISDDDISSGFPVTNLPAGILELTPLQGSAEGTIVADAPQLRMARSIEGTCMRFKLGELTHISASRNERVLKKLLCWDSTEKPVLRRFCIGLNPNMEPGYMFDEICLGHVFIAVGDRRSEGCMMSFVLKDATVLADARKIIDKGAKV